MSGRAQPLNGADSEPIDNTRRQHLNLLAIESRIRTGRRTPTCRTPVGRFMDLLSVVESGCWEWQGQISDVGYPRLGIRGSVVYAHRFSHELYHGPIPDGYHVDHLCHNTRCVNPAHLEAVPARVNVFERGKGEYHQPYRDGVCRRGHPMTAGNIYVRPDGHGRMCRACQRIRAQQRCAS